MSEGGESVCRVDTVAADDVETEVEVDSVEQHQEAESDVKHGSALSRYSEGDFYWSVMSSWCCP